jgi:RNA polymerase sigma-70 factor, ECF subfamily
VSSAGSDNYAALEQHREYLALLAQLQIDPRLQGKVDLSGVVQQTLWEAFQAFRVAAVEDSAARLAWMRKALAHNLVDEVRKLTVQKQDALREQSIDRAVEQSSIRLNAWLAAETSLPSQQIQRQERALHLASALSRLLPAEREVVVLRHWQDWSLAEIAAHLGRSNGSVAGLLKRAHRKLRDEFPDFEEGR